MTLENICNEDLLVNYDNTAGPPDIVYVADLPLSASVTTTQSTKVDLPPGKKACTTSVTYVWALAHTPPTQCPHTSATYNFVAGGGILTATAKKVEIEGNAPMRENDTNITGCTGTWSLKSNPATIVACTCDVTISSAGQSKVRCQ